jgi:pimeloyl-ACP methyl ester carboxylesterase
MKYISSDGLNIAVEEFGQGQPVIFAHGLSGNRHGSRDQLLPLADQYRVIIYDQRGHCDSSPVTNPTLYDPARMGEDMRAVMDACGVRRAIVGGESMGVTTTLKFALAHPDRVEKIVLTAPAFGDGPNAESARLQEMGKTIRAIGLEKFLAAAAVRQRDDLGWSPQVIGIVRERFASHNAVSLATALQTVVGWKPFPDLAVFAQIACPMYILAWDGDTLHPYELAQRLANIFPNARLEKIPTLPAIFENPPLVGEAYRRFLETGK